MEQSRMKDNQATKCHLQVVLYLVYMSTIYILILYALCVIFVSNTHTPTKYRTVSRIHADLVGRLRRYSTEAVRTGPRHAAEESQNCTETEPTRRQR